MCGRLKFYEDGKIGKAPLKIFSGYVEPYVINRDFFGVYSEKEISGTPFRWRGFLDESEDDEVEYTFNYELELGEPGTIKTVDNVSMVPRTVSFKFLIPIDSVTITPDNILISSAEVQRFEAENSTKYTADDGGKVAAAQRHVIRPEDHRAYISHNF